MDKLKLQFILVFFSLLLYNCSKDEIITENNDDDNTEEVEELLIPKVEINTLGSFIQDEPKIKAEMQILSLDNSIDFSGTIGIEYRGSSSQMFPKKQFAIEIWDESNEGVDASLLELPEEEDWILSAPYSDKSLIRNVLMYSLARKMNHYASRTKFVELSLNNAFQGLYVLTEKLKRDKNRIDISKLKEEDISGEELTGGYILKIDKANGTDEFSYTDYNSFLSEHRARNANNQNIYFNYEYPKAVNIKTEQKEYIKQYVRDFENSLAGDDFKDITNGYSKYIDVDSFVDFFILNELANNVDGYRLSTYLTKNKNEPLKIGPLWDFNLALGNANYCDGNRNDVWAYKFNERCPGDFWVIPFWWERLLEDDNFKNKLKSRWSSLRLSTLSNSEIFNEIDDYTDELNNSDAVKNNFDKWPILGEYIWPNNYIGSTYADEINYLKSFLNTRLQWLDTEINSL